ncbi:hypothetical protein CEXT_417991 [Caerostris extrusa]|uniref:Uncharacterized protein n=1 Tax=Caerostris extrusa TaxID=172846 RepID=A0AAV4VDU7_CAEEX|nr:hypothetical protein CEXT_417991 [Caerostris extrusa]
MLEDLFKFGGGSKCTNSHRGRPGIIEEFESKLSNNELCGVSELEEVQQHEIPTESIMDWQLPCASTVEDWKTYYKPANFVTNI